jgi:release factor glutamine methyltransferase
VGRQPFRELELEVGPGVLVPRPETEVLVALVGEWLRERGSETVRALDLGTGSGAIALSLAYEGYCTHVVATDVSGAALDTARRNRDAAELTESVELRSGSLFEPLQAGERFGVIVSNPPYVAEVDEAGLEPEVRDWEPREALFAGSDGLDVIRRIAAGAGPFLEQGGLLALEVGADQAEAVSRLLRETGMYHDVRVLRDYAGRQRFVFAHGA